MLANVRNIKYKWFALLVSANTRVKFLDGIASFKTLILYPERTFKTLILYPERTFKTLLLYPERTQFELLDKKTIENWCIFIRFLYRKKVKISRKQVY